MVRVEPHRFLDPIDRDRPDVLPIVEAAYAIDAPLRAWVQRLLESADISVGEGLGGFACVFRASSNGTLAIDRSSAAVLPQLTDTSNAILDGLARARCRWLSSHLQVGGGWARFLVTSAVDLGGQAVDRRHLTRSGVPKGLTLVCMDLDQRGVLLSLGILSDARISSATRASLARVATHILAAFRLRLRLRDDGTLARPEPTAHTRDATRARGLARLTPTERSVVSHIARDLSTKEVAYTLGISDATVRVLLMRAARRCGVDCRAALLALWRDAMTRGSPARVIAAGQQAITRGGRDHGVNRRLSKIQVRLV